MTRVLVLDDEENIRFFFTEALKKEGYDVRTVGKGDRALELFSDEDFDVAVVDLKLPDADGMEIMKTFRAQKPAVPVIIITAHGNKQIAHQALSEGAYDYFSKPFDLEDMRVVIRRAAENARLLQEVEILRQQMEEGRKADAPRLIGDSAAMDVVKDTIATVAESDVTCLILGESGTGKELVAELIHQKSNRADGPFVTLNCAAIPDTLIETEMFGYEKGAFTGAVQQTSGKFEQADGGTLFLDEIGDMTPMVQTKLLRVIETGEFHRVGGASSVRVNVRLLAATNKDLKKAIEEGNFREDLFYRINVVSLPLPPLRQRPEDIPVLVTWFLAQFNEKYNKSITGVDEEVMARLLEYSWPGNVRELQNVLQRVVVLERNDSVTFSSVPEMIGGSPSTATLSLDELAGQSLSDALKQVRSRFERVLIEEALERSGGNKSEAARILKISRVNLHQKINEYEIENGNRAQE
ncbi:sigma-54-dependent transcriptional regulator [Candidatus Zixiibacteriota bacterium]